MQNIQCTLYTDVTIKVLGKNNTYTGDAFVIHRINKKLSKLSKYAINSYL